MSNSMYQKKPLHITTLSLVIQGLDDKWEEYFQISKHDIKVHNQRMVTDQIVKEMIKDITKRLRVHSWKGMRKLNLKLNRCESITDKSLRAIAVHLQPHIDQMLKLNLDLTSCSSITESGLKDLTLGITRSLNRIKQLHLIYPDCPAVTEKSLRAIDFRLMNKPASLQELAINCSISLKITDKSISTFIFKVLGCLQNFKSLSLDLSNCDVITEKSLECLGNMLHTRLDELEHLNLELSRFRCVTDKSLKALFTGFPCKLKSLTLNFSEAFGENGITDERLRLIASYIAGSHYIKNLQKLSLDLTRCYEIRDKGFQSLVTEIINKGINLRQTHLYFSFCYDLPNAVLGSIDTVIQPNQKKFKPILFDLTGCNLIDADKVKEITKKTRGAIKFKL